jgi:16S rRNA (guanine527-N7)-methyltransferase
LSFDFASLAPLDAPAWFFDKAASMGVEFDTGDVEILGRYLAAMLHANRHVNLTALTEPNAAWERHVLDSLSLMSVLAELGEGARVLDVGSGAGLPGIPLAVCMPQVRFTLLEATGKKIEFLRAVVRWLGLKNVSVVHGRAEAVGHDRGERGPAGAARSGGHREAYDAVVARAVGRLATLAELTVPFAKVGGTLAHIKGAKAQEELDEAREALHVLKCVAGQIVTTPTGAIVLIEKPVATPRTYPRSDGEPSRAPLGVKRDARDRGKE